MKNKNVAKVPCDNQNRGDLCPSGQECFVESSDFVCKKVPVKKTTESPAAEAGIWVGSVTAVLIIVAASGFAYYLAKKGVICKRKMASKIGVAKGGRGGKSGVCVVVGGRAVVTDRRAVDNDGCTEVKDGRAEVKDGRAEAKDGCAVVTDRRAVDKDGRTEVKDGRAEVKDGRGGDKDGAVVEIDGRSGDKDGPVETDGCDGCNDGLGGDEVRSPL